jgi:hypothetical protein
MAVESKPLFHPEVIRKHVREFKLPEHVPAFQEKLSHWAELISSGKADDLKETALLPDFLTDFFCELLGYTRPSDGGGSFTLSREQHVEDDGKFADAVLGRFAGDREQFIVALEGKGTRDPLDRPFAGRKMSAVDQCYRYAINLPCDWIIVTSMRETRLYHKGSNQHTYERFETVRLATEPARLKRFIFLLGAERVVPEKRDCHLYDLLKASEAVGRQLTNEFYALYAGIRSQVLNRLCHDNPNVDPQEILRCTQKLLDRVLFCAFCEDRGLLPDETLKRAFEHNDPYNPRPIWQNFRGLFRSIDEGNSGLNIPAYNGGLFAHDPGLDTLNVPDEVCAHFKELGEYEYRPARDVAEEEDDDTEIRQIIDVEILGHIFEQSITDLERLRQDIEGDGAPSDEKKAKSRRKKEGAFYTPEFITRYIVEQALGGVLKDRFEKLRQKHESEATGTAPKALRDPNAYDLASLNEPQRKALIKFWEAWQETLATIRILDPACGSGAFLIEAFDQLYAVFEVSNTRLEELRGQRTLFDLDRQILQNNLYGVDLNPEAIQICQLSLWIKTAARGKQLTSLDHTICEGNSVVNDPEVHPRAFDWQAAFPEVFGQGGFDVVIGNPPYIRQEWLAPFKPFWETRYQSYHGVADIFTYFFEQGIEVLRTGGQLAYITSGSWVRGNFGAPLRRFLSANAKMESMVDFGEFQPFEDAEMIRPSITILSKNEPSGEMKLFKWLTSGRPPETLSDEISKSPAVQNDRFDEGAWELESDGAIRLREKLTNHGCALSTLSSKPILMGVKPGTTEAFVVSSRTRDALIAEDPSCKTLFLPFTRGQDVRPWHAEDSGLWAISLCSSDQREWPWTNAGPRAEQVFADTYPSLHRHMLKFETQLKGRKDNIRFWWELRSCAYWHQIFVPRIEWPDITNQPRFTITHSSGVIGDTAFIVPGEDYFLLGILASWTTWFFISKTAQPLRLRSDRWQYRLKAQYMGHIPIPNASADDREAISRLAQTCCSLGRERYLGQVAFQKRLLQSFGPESDGKLNQKAEAWWERSFNELGAALKTSFKLKANPMKSPKVADEWEPYFEQKQKTNTDLTNQLAAAEAELNDRVYRLFNLTPEEIRLLQKEVEH